MTSEYQYWLKVKFSQCAVTRTAIRVPGFFGSGASANSTLEPTGRDLKWEPSIFYFFSFFGRREFEIFLMILSISHLRFDMGWVELFVRSRPTPPPASHTRSALTARAVARTVSSPHTHVTQRDDRAPARALCDRAGAATAAARARSPARSRRAPRAARAGPAAGRPPPRDPCRTPR